ncbi:MAG TPA: hypothetical protein DCE44_16405, partial [Verrucomicrobiales bacterium]|nr:hypothetical protein [Verrucomicrobiales bacterium]
VGGATDRTDQRWRGDSGQSVSQKAVFEAFNSVSAVRLKGMAGSRNWANCQGVSPGSAPKLCVFMFSSFQCYRVAST